MKLNCMNMKINVFLFLVAFWCFEVNAKSAYYDVQLYEAAIAEKGSLINTLEELVGIETLTYDEVGIPEMGAYLEKRLRALGAEVERFAATDGKVGDNVVGRFKGDGEKSIFLMIHFDTVYPRGTLAQAPFRVEGDKAYGPGITDPKGGVAVVLHALKLLQADKFSNYKTITVLFNADEEIGSVGSRDLIKKFAAQSDYVMSFESVGDTIVTGTSGTAYVDAVITGRASHAGAAPLDGINALTVASDFVMRTQDIQDIPNGKTFNWTMANAGVTRNTIAPEATLKGDMRYVLPNGLEEMSASLQSRASKPLIEEASIFVTVTPGHPPFTMSKEGYQLSEKAIAILSDVGITTGLSTVRSGGATDAGHAQLSGKPIIEGLGLRGGAMHSAPGLEYVDLATAAAWLYLAARMIKELGGGI